MKIGLFEARCAACDAVFSKPELSDFAYGEFLFTGELGSVHAYFHAINHPLWTWLEDLLPASMDDTEQGRLLREACAHFADRVEGQRLLDGHVCPKCLSHSLASWSGPRRGEAEIPMASFTRFSSLSEDDRLREAEAFLRSAP